MITTSEFVGTAPVDQFAGSDQLPFSGPIQIAVAACVALGASTSVATSRARGSRFTWRGTLGVFFAGIRGKGFIVVGGSKWGY